MEVPTTTFVGSHSGQQIAHTNPMEKNRRPTDKSFIFVFLLIVIAWLGACILGFHGDHGPKKIYKPTEKITKTDSDMDELFSLYSSVVLITLILGSLGILYCIFLNSKITKFSIYVGLGLYILNTSHMVIINSSSIYGLFFYCSQLIVSIVCTVSFFKVDKSVVFDVIKDACRIVVYNPSIILFSCLISILELSVILFTWKALILYLLHSSGEYYMTFGFVVMITCGVCIVSFLLSFTIMVVNDYTVNYYWKNASIIQSLDRVVRNHMGTIAFSSMLFVPFLCTLVQALKHKRSRKNDENIIVYYTSKLYLVFSILWTAMTFSSIYGTGYVKSTQKMFDTLLHRCVLYMATIGAFLALCAIDTASICISLLGGQLIYMKNFQDPSSEDIKITLYLVLCVTVYPIVIFTLPLYSSAQALLVNKMIMLNKEDQCTDGKNEILNRL